MSIRTFLYGVIALVSALSGAVNAQKIYWVGDLPGGGISRVNLDETNREIVAQSNFARLDGLAIDIEGNKLYWADTYLPAIKRIDLDGSNIESIVTVDLDEPTAIAVDPQGEFVYWADEMRGHIRRANLNGTHVESIVEITPDHRTGIAFDAELKALYWTDGGTVIRRMDMNSGVVEDIVVEGLQHAYEVAFDVVMRRLYWINGYPRAVWSADVDGSGSEPVVLAGDYLEHAARLAIDGSIGKIYWTWDYDVGPGVLMRSNLDGTDLESLVQGQFTRGVALAPLAGKLYWADASNGRFRILSAHLDGTNIEELINSGIFLGHWNDGIATDPGEGLLFWSCNWPWYDANDVNIQRATLDGRNVTNVVYNDSVHDVTLDQVNRRLYWYSRSFQIARITSADYDGASRVVLIDDYDLLKNVKTIAIDPLRDSLYWTNQTKLYRSNLAGEAIGEIIQLPPGQSLGSIAVDPFSGFIYAVSDGIVRINPVSGAVENVIAGVQDIWKLEIDPIAANVYWTVANQEGIRRANLDGSNVETLMDVPYYIGIAINPVSHIANSSPITCSIDARQPHDIDDLMFRYGWWEIDLAFSGTLGLGEPLDFEVIESGGDGVPPNIETVTLMDRNTVHITLDDVIGPGAWTCFYHINSGTKSCLGYLPGDVDGDGTSSPVDILRLIDSLNGVVDPPYEVWQTDINRSGATEPTDILRVIDLLNGASKFEVWNGRTLGGCP